MACPDPNLLMAVEEDVLPEEMAASVREHLAGCAICQCLQRDLRVLSESSRELVPVRRRMMWPAIGIAASLLLGIAIWRTSSTVTVPVPIAVQPVQNIPSYRIALVKAPLRLSLQDAVIFRGKESGRDDVYLRALGEALAPYRADRFEEAAATLQALSQKYPKAVEPQFYQGVALLLAGKAAAALGPLQAAEKLGSDTLAEDIAWYLAITEERSTSWEAAARRLAEICKGGGIHKADACAVLESK